MLNSFGNLFIRGRRRAFLINIINFFNPIIYKIYAFEIKAHLFQEF